jgi:hypothetical protein
MSNDEALRRIVEDLIHVMHVQAKDLETLIDRVEQVAGRLSSPPLFSIIASELSELHARTKKLIAP